MSTEIDEYIELRDKTIKIEEEINRLQGKEFCHNTQEYYCLHNKTKTLRIINTFLFWKKTTEVKICFDCKELIKET